MSGERGRSKHTKNRSDFSKNDMWLCLLIRYSDERTKELQLSNCRVNNNKFSQQHWMCNIYRIVNTFSPINHGNSITAYSNTDNFNTLTWPRLGQEEARSLWTFLLLFSIWWTICIDVYFPFNNPYFLKYPYSTIGTSFSNVQNEISVYKHATWMPILPEIQHQPENCKNTKS